MYLLNTNPILFFKTIPDASIEFCQQEFNAKLESDNSLVTVLLAIIVIAIAVAKSVTIKKRTSLCLKTKELIKKNELSPSSQKLWYPRNSTSLRNIKRTK